MALKRCDNCKFYIPQMFDDSSGICKMKQKKRLDGTTKGYEAVKNDYVCDLHQKKFDQDVK